MDQPMRDFTDLLLRRGVVSLDQLSEATTCLAITIFRSATP